jgi:nitrogen regulatory protein PII
MQLLVLVLNKVEKLENLLKDFVHIGIKGATVIDSTGMARVLHDDLDSIPIFGSIKMLINENYPYNKTVFVVLKDEQIKPTIESIKKTVGDLSKPNVGILFTLPVNYVEGIKDE